MRLSRTNLLSLGLVLAAFAMTGALYSRLPHWVPTHWNARGVANGFMPKPWGPFVGPLIMAGTYLFLTLLVSVTAWISSQDDRARRSFEIVQATVLAFLFLVTTLVLLAGIGVRVRMELLAFGVPALLVCIYVLNRRQRKQGVEQLSQRTDQSNTGDGVTAAKNKYWFAAKAYGYGWGLPSSWQGWLVLAVWLVLMWVGSVAIAPKGLAQFLAYVAVLGGLLIGVCWLKGEPLRWRWGNDRLPTS